MSSQLSAKDRFALVHPSIDAHTLGLSSFADLLVDCGIACILAPREVDEALCRPQEAGAVRELRAWLVGQGVTVIGFSYRLDPEEGLRLFAGFMATLEGQALLADKGGPIASVFFAGLPATCELVQARFPRVTATFKGDETPPEILDILGLPRGLLPREETEGAVYDEARLAFGRELLARGDYRSIQPLDRSGSRRYGIVGDTVTARIAHGSARGLPPLMRAHVGPFLPERKEAIELFLDWTARLAKAGLLDILSIGTSQLSQSEFGRDWAGRPDGGGVPIATPEEFARVWQAARPMLVRSYAGTRDVEAMARMLEGSIDNAWHALSLWWFCQIDGRGPNTVLQNLREHTATMSYLASIDRPFEPNVPHHFGFRGGDDLTYVLSGLVAAKAAKAAGIRRLILQVMLNTPRSTWGVYDLAKARALLHLVRELEDSDFKVYLQPRGGLDYFSNDGEKAKVQLAAVTALMDDIEPNDPASPQIIHVVSYSEGYALADPEIVNDSIRITRQALTEYRRMRKLGIVDDMSSNHLVLSRTSELLKETRTAIKSIEDSIASPYGAEGLYEILASGYLAVPHLSACRQEFAAATQWRTRTIHGSVRVVDDLGLPIPLAERLASASGTARLRASQAGRKGGKG